MSAISHLLVVLSYGIVAAALAFALLDDYRTTGAAIDVLDLAQTMKRNGIDLVAEKVETERSVAELLDFSVDFGQGILFGEPRLARDAA